MLSPWPAPTRLPLCLVDMCPALVSLTGFSRLLSVPQHPGRSEAPVRTGLPNPHRPADLSCLSCLLEPPQVPAKRAYISILNKTSLSQNPDVS